jgi:glycogen operon protein
MRQQRNFLATLLLSIGTPMLLGGDELGRTQGGNNNAWCQDTEIAWFDWELGATRRALLEFTRRVIALRHEHAAFRRTNFLAGQDLEDQGVPDAWWFRPDGRRMTQRDWNREDGHIVGVFLNGEELREVDEHGRDIVDDSFLLLFNAHYEDVDFNLPNERFGQVWCSELSTAEPDEEPGARRYDARASVTVASRSLLVLRRAE